MPPISPTVLNAGWPRSRRARRGGFEAPLGSKRPKLGAAGVRRPGSPDKLVTLWRNAKPTASWMGDASAGKPSGYVMETCLRVSSPLAAGASVQTDFGLTDHIAEPPRFALDEAGKLLAGLGKRFIAEAREFLSNVGCGQCLVDVALDFVRHSRG